MPSTGILPLVDPTMAPYLWRVDAIEAIDKKAMRHVRLSSALGTAEFWTDQAEVLERLTVGDYYQMGLAPTYPGVRVAVEAAASA